jgi:signal transduction histidine kinase
LVTLRRLVHGALAEMRTLLFELRPEALRAAPVDTLLERLGTALSGQIQVPVQVSVREDTALPQEVKVTLYRVAQEALSNVAKYARATQVSVSLVADDHGATLAVEDDGRGFDPACVAPECMGMRIMGERLRQIGGTIAIGSEAGRGTSVVASWPRSAQGVPTRLEEVSDEQPGAHPGDDRR